MKPKSTLRHFLCIASSALLSISYSHADTFVWDPTNVTATPPATLDWFTGGANPLGLWTGVVVPVSNNTNTIQFFANTTTNLPNTALPSTQTVNLNNGGLAFELGALTLNGLGSATSAASLTMTLQGDALNFSAATGTISFNSVKNVAPASDTVINYNINNNIQLGTASSASALTLNGGGDNAGTTTYNIVGAISELQAGGGSLIKSGTNNVTVSGAINITGAVTVSSGALTLSSGTNTASSFTVNGGSLILTGNLTPASGSMTVNTGGILRIGNNTATQFGPAGVYSGNISTGTGGTLQLWSSSTQEISGIISGSGGINKAYGGALTLSGANTYTGRSSFIPQNTTGFTQNVASFNSVFTNVGLGTVHSASSTLGAPTTVANGTIDVGGNAQAGITLNYTGGGEITDRVVAVAWNGNSTQTIQASGGGLLSFTSAFTAASSGGTGSLVLTGAGDGQVNGITGSINSTGLSKTGNGTWTISGASTFTQVTTITAGILNLSSATALQNSPFNTASTAGTGSIGLKTSVTTLTLGGLTGSNALRGRFTTALGGPSSLTAQGGYDGLTNLTLNTAGGSTIIYTGAIVDGATGMTLTKTGAGIQTLNTVHSYTGTTSVNGGFLQLNGNALAGGLSVSNAHFASNSTFAGLASVTSGGVISPGASFGAIGTLTLSNATASALTLNGSTGIFDLPSTVTTPDQIAVTGGLVVNGTNTVLLRTPLAGTPAGVYTLMTAGSTSGAGSFVLANGSATRGNATISVSGNDVILTVGAGGLAGTTTYIGTSGNFNVEKWFVTTNWDSGVVPTGTTNVVLPDQTAAMTIPAFNTGTTAFSGDLWIGNNVTLQVGSTTGNAAFNNVLGTLASTIIYMGQNSAINSRNSGFNPTLPQIVLLGDASMRFQESTQVKVDPNFANSISGNFTLTLNSGAGNGFSTATLNAANSFAGLNLAGTTGTVNAAASGSIGTANLTISGGGTVNLNHATALSDGTNAIRINNGTLAYGTTAAAPLTLNTRPIELNGTGQATIANNASSSANILTLDNSISSTAAGAKTLFFSGTNTGLNLVSSNITNGTGGGSIAVTKNAAGTWVLSGDNSYTGQTTVANNGTLVLSGDNSAMSGGVVLSSNTSVTPKLHINSATALGTGTLNFGGGAASDTVQIDNSSAGTVNVSTANAITMNRNFTFVGSQNLSLGTAGGVTTLGGMTSGSNRSITVTANTLTLGGTIAEATTNLGIAKAGAGTLVLSGTGNSYTGATTVSAGILACPVAVQGFGTNLIGISIGGSGTLSLRNDNSVSFTNGTSAYNIANSASGASINVDRVTGTGSNTLTVGNLTTSSIAATWQLNFTGANGVGLSAGTLITPTAAAGSHTINNNIAGGGNLTLGGVTGGGTGAAATLIFTGSANTTVSGAISQVATNQALTKNGAGTLLLNGTNTYTGLTTISAGTLGGTGTIAGAVTVAASGNLAPGASIGTLTINNNLTVSAMAGGSGVMTYELGPIVTSDKIAITGTLDIGAGALGFNNFSFSNAGGLQNGTYKLITSGAAVTGSLDGGNLTGTVGSGSGTLQITGNDLELVVSGIGAGTPYDTWASSKGLTGANNAKNLDPDNDGRNNLGEFAFNGDPLSGSDNGKIAGLVQNISAPSGNEMTLIVAVRDSATFGSVGSPAVQTAAVDGVTYTIEGTLDLVTIPGSAVSKIGGASDTAPLASGLPSLAGTDWEYHTFKLDASEALPNKGFLRAKATAP